jgi:DHA2 family multidrug resistance protein
VLENLGRYGNAVLAYVNAEVTRQALFIAYLDDFKLMMMVTFVILPLLFFMKRGNKVGGGGPPIHMD